MWKKEYLFSQEIYSMLMWNMSAQRWRYLAPVEQPLRLHHQFSLPALAAFSLKAGVTLLLCLWRHYLRSFKPEGDCDAGCRPCEGMWQGGLVYSWPQEMQICCCLIWCCVTVLWIGGQLAVVIKNASKASSGWNKWKYWANNWLELGWAHCSPWLLQNTYSKPKGFVMLVTRGL